VFVVLEHNLTGRAHVVLDRENNPLAVSVVLNGLREFKFGW
jgi:hypothetical protein